MSFPRYERYKETGVEWLGEVPDGWEVMRLAALFKEANDVGKDDLPILTVSIHNGVSDREFAEEELDRKVTRSEDRTQYKGVVPGDLVYNMMRAWQGGFGAVAVYGQVSPAYVVARPITKHSTVFIESILRTPQAVGEMKRFSHGITDFRLRLYWEKFKTIRIVLPSPKDQDTVVTFLKIETQKIDALIAAQEELIALLKEKQQAVISHAVTKGLNPNAPMKDSGIEWLGEVPASWTAAALTYRYEVALGKMLDEKRITGYHLAPYLRNTDVQWDHINTTELPQMDFSGNDLDRYSLKPGDLLVCEGGEVGRAAIWNGELSECYYQKALHRLRPKNPTADNPRFMFYLLRHAVAQGRFSSNQVKATIVHLTAEALRRYRFCFPTLDEQNTIVSHLDGETKMVDALISEVEKAMNLLAERRSSLISAAVTGKIDVRGLVGTKSE